MSLTFDIHQVASVATTIKTFDFFKIVELQLTDHEGKHLGTLNLYQSRGSIPEMLPITDRDCRDTKEPKIETT